MAADGKGGATPKRHSGGEKHGGHKKGHQQQHSGGGGSKPFHKKPKFQQDRGTKRGAGAGNGGDGEGPANKKRRVKMERAKAKPAFDLVARAKAIWATFRSKRQDKAERERLAEELFGLIKGRLHQIAVKHDAARVVQCALLHGSPAQREAYTTELLEHLLEFAKVQYAHFIILRLLDVTANQPGERKRILRVFSGKAHTLATHAVGAKVLEGIFSTYPKQDTQALRSELYGREAQLLLAGVVGGGAAAAAAAEKGRDLKAVLAELPERREKVLAGVLTAVTKMLNKDLVTLPFVQELLWEYVANAGPQAVRDLVPSLVDYMLLLTGTRPGCKVLSECAGYGTPKDRKKMLKALKGYVVPTLLHKDAYLFILRLADVMDDTVAFHKAVWQELLERDESEATMLRFATHVKASKVLLSLLAPAKRTTFLTKEELELLRPVFVPATATAPAVAAEGEAPAPADGEMVPTSKKDADLRRAELVAPLKDALVRLGRAHAHELLPSAEGSFVLYEVATRWRDPALLEAVAVAAAADAKEEAEESEESAEEEQGAMEGENDEAEEQQGSGDEDEEQKKAPAQQAQQQSPPVEDAEAAGPLREHRIAYRTMKRLLLFEAATPKTGAAAKAKASAAAAAAAATGEALQPLFAEGLYRQATGRWLEWLGSMRGGFVVEALVKVPGVGPQVLKELQLHEKELEALAADNLKGAAAVLQVMRGGGPQQAPGGGKSRQAGGGKGQKK